MMMMMKSILKQDEDWKTSDQKEVKRGLCTIGPFFLQQKLAMSSS